jgi:hypothetical protein
MVSPEQFSDILDYDIMASKNLGGRRVFFSSYFENNMERIEDYFNHFVNLIKSNEDKFLKAMYQYLGDWNYYGIWFPAFYINHIKFDENVGKKIIDLLRKANFSSSVIKYDDNLIDALIKTDLLEVEDADVMIYKIGVSGTTRRNIKKKFAKYICNNDKFKPVWGKLKKRMKKYIDPNWKCYNLVESILSI